MVELCNLKAILIIKKVYRPHPAPGLETFLPVVTLIDEPSSSSHPGHHHAHDCSAHDDCHDHVDGNGGYLDTCHLASMVAPVAAATGFARSSSTIVGNPWVTNTSTKTSRDASSDDVVM